MCRGMEGRNISPAAAAIVAGAGIQSREDRVADQFWNGWNYGVSEGFKSVHPLGYPMSHSTHVGFNCPEPSDACMAWSNLSLDRSLPFLRVKALSLDPLYIDATGVGHVLTAVCRFMPPVPCNPAPVPQLAVGVGQSPRSIACTVSAKFSPNPEEARRINVASFVPGPADRLSIAFGVGNGASQLRGNLPADRSATAFVLLASGVGNNPDAVPSVRCTNGARWNAMPFRVIPDLGQGPENNVQPSTKQRCHVLQDDVFRSNHANGSNHFPEESRTGAGKSGASPGIGYVLAGEACADNFGIGIFSLRYVTEIDGVGEPQGENLRSVRINFRDCDGLESACPLQAKIEAAYAREHGNDPQLARKGRARTGYSGPSSVSALGCAVYGVCTGDHSVLPLVHQGIAEPEQANREQGDDADDESADHAATSCSDGTTLTRFDFASASIAKAVRRFKAISPDSRR